MIFTVGIYRWSAVIVGFVGVLVIVAPATIDLKNYGVLVGLAASFTTALVSIFLRDMGKTIFANHNKRQMLLK